MADRFRVFLVGVSADDLDALTLRVRQVGGLEIIGRALLRSLQSGDSTVPPQTDAVLTSRLVHARTRAPGARASEQLVEQLTPRELAVLTLAADGLSNRAIASELEISEHTVKFHLAAVFGKLGVSSRTEAVRRGLSLGLIEI